MGKYLFLLLIFLLVSCLSSSVNKKFEQKAFLNKENFLDFTIEGKFLLKSQKAFEVFFRKKGKDFYKLSFYPNKANFYGGILTREKSLGIDVDQWHIFKLVVDGNCFDLFLNEKKVFSLKDGFFRKGRIEIPVEEKSFVYKDIMVSKIDNGQKTVALSSNQALKSFQFGDSSSLRIKLLADEKLIKNPVTARYDIKGRLWVVEMSGYMRKVGDKVYDVPSGSIAILSDEDNDGVFDKREEFLSNVLMPRTICFYQGGVLYADQDNLYFVKGGNDGKAKNISVVDKDYAGTYDPEKDSNGLLRGIDNWIYSANSSFRYKRVNGVWKKERIGRRGQWGLSQDSYGRLFYTANSVPIIGDYFLPNMFISEKNNFLKNSSVYSSYINNKVYPIVNSFVNRGYLPNFLNKLGVLNKATSISGGTIYGGKNLPEIFHGAFFSTEPAAALIKVFSINEDKSRFKVGKIFRNKEFLNSYDRLFRPVDIQTAPDGSLSVVDFHRGIIQHNIYLTDYLKKLSDDNELTDVIDLGRIYKIYDSSRPLDKFVNLGELSLRKLIPFLGHHNSWWRLKAQNLIVDSADKSLKNELVKYFFENENELARIHALWSLEGLGLMDEKLAVEFLGLENNTQWVRNHIFHSLREKKKLKNRKLFFLIKESVTNQTDNHIKAYPLQLLSKFSTRSARETFKKIFHQYKKDKTYSSILLNSVSQKELNKTYGISWSGIFPSKKGGAKTVSLSQEKSNIIRQGKQIYSKNCSFCHAAYGQGINGVAPPLIKSDWVSGSKERLIAVILKGLIGKITINGKVYDGSGVMPNFEKKLSDKQISHLLSMVRNSFSNSGSLVTEKEVAKVRKKLRSIKNILTEKKLKSLFKGH